MAPECPYHREHETRLKLLEEGHKEMKDKIGNPAISVALISLAGVVITALTSGLCVIFAPVIRAWFGV